MVEQVRPKRGRGGSFPRLTDKQRAAVDAYYGRAKFNKTRALEIAGYADPNGHICHVWNRPGVQAYIAEKEADLQRRYRLDFDMIVQEIAKIAYSNIADYLEFTEDGGVVFRGKDADYSELAALGEVTVETYVEGAGEDAQTVKRVKFKPYNKLSALDLLLRHTGQSKDKLKVEGEFDLVERIRGAKRQIGREDNEEQKDD